PVLLKVDISPLCNLHCTICVHARPIGDRTAELDAQRFRASDKMSVKAFTALADEVAGKTAAVSLYYLGDPIVHPHLEEICRVASSRGLNSHISTNFSVPLSDDRVVRLVETGLTHLTVCVDGLSQDTYNRTRVGGRIDVVLNNLGRLLEYRTRA